MALYNLVALQVWLFIVALIGAAIAGVTYKMLDGREGLEGKPHVSRPRTPW